MSDYISREAVCEICADVFGLPIDDGEEVIFEINRRVKRLPAADVRPVVRGKWIDAVLPNDNGGLPVIVCDQCNTFYPLQFGASHRFCPNCGADMRGEQE